MAWIYKRPDSERWWVGWRQNGRQVLKSTGQTDKKKAQEELAKIEAMLALQRANALTLEAFEAISGRQIPAKPVADAIADWLSEARGSTGPRTVEKYEHVAAEFSRYLTNTGRNGLVSGVTRDDVQAFLAHKRGQVSAATANMARKCLAVFFRRCKAAGMMRDNPMDGVKLFKAGREEKRIRRPFSSQEVASLFNVAPDDFWRYAVLGGFTTGLRLGDLATMPLGAVDWRRRCLRIVVRKTGKTMLIPLADPFYAMLTRLKARRKGAVPSDPFWPEHAERYEATGAGWFGQRFYDLLLVPAGLAKARPHRPSGKGQTRRKVSEVSFHCLRHSYVSTLAGQGQSQQIVKALAGHSSDEINDLYTKLPVDVLTAAVRQLPDITITSETQP